MLDARRDPCGAVSLPEEVSRVRTQDDTARGYEQQLPPVGMDMQVAPCPGILPFIKGINESMLTDWFCGGGFVKARLMEVAELILSYLCLYQKGFPVCNLSTSNTADGQWRTCEIGCIDNIV